MKDVEELWRDTYQEGFNQAEAIYARERAETEEKYAKERAEAEEKYARERAEAEAKYAKAIAIAVHKDIQRQGKSFEEAIQVFLPLLSASELTCVKEYLSTM